MLSLSAVEKGKISEKENLQMPLLNINVDFCIGNGIGLFVKEQLNDKTRLTPAQDPIIKKWKDDNEVNI